MRNCHHIVWRLRILVFAICFAKVASTSAQLDTLLTSSETQGRQDRDSAYDELSKEVSALEHGGNILKKVVKLVTPTVVHLESFKTNGPLRSKVSIEEAGSGVVVELNGSFFVLTNRHVVNDASLDNIKIRLSDGRIVASRRVWSDRETDVAVIMIRAENLVAARLGDSDKMEIGDFVLAVGSPFGLSHSVSYGIISAKGRRDLELGSDEIRLQDFMQTDAAINPGNSGGPLLNLRGEVIGINTAIASNSGGNEGVSFAIPINMVMFVAKQLISSGTVEHAYLGVTLDNEYDAKKALSLGLKAVRGALVKEVRPKSPAFFANLKSNDLIIGFDGKVVEDDDHLVNLVSMAPVDSVVNLDIIRTRKPLRISIKVGKRANFEK